jgi:hypothetical protein
MQQRDVIGYVYVCVKIYHRRRKGKQGCDRRRNAGKDRKGESWLGPQGRKTERVDEGSCVSYSLMGVNLA